MLTLCALLWSMVSFLATVGTRVPIQPTTLSYTPGARALIVMLAFGAFALYPIGRVSTARDSWPPARVVLDGLVFSALFTVLFWPMQLVTFWSRSTSVALWILVLGWIWVAAGVVSCALTVRPGMTRSLLALACPFLLAAGALLDAMGWKGPLPALLGPAVAVLDLAPRNSWQVSDATLPIALFPVCVAMIVWSIACMRARRAFAPLAWGR